MKCRNLLAICAGIAGAWLYAGAGFAEDASTLAKNPDLWPAPGRDLALTRHSDLNQINTKNVQHLQLAWDQSTGALRGHEGQSLVVDVDGTPMMYIFSAWPNIVQALDLTDPDYPKEVWNYVKKTDRDESAVPRACCDTVNRGGSYADGKVVYLTLDGWLIALDAKTGKEAWVVKNNYPDKGEDGTPAPLIADGKVFVGFGGDEFAARGSFMAYDLKTGKQLWKKYSTGTDADVGITADTNKDNRRHAHTAGDLGVHTFPDDNNYKIGGGAAWGWYSYDPVLKYIYYGTGNPGLWSPGYRCGEKPLDQAKCSSGKWDNKWSLTIFARKADTGEAVWAFQMTPFDQWDYDGINEMILVDMPNVDGKPLKALVHFDRNGFEFVLNRVTGELVRAHKYVTANWAEKYDMQTERPIKVPEHSPLEVGRNTQACPSAMGGKDQQPASVDPSDPTKFYVPTNNWCMEDNPQIRAYQQQGTVYVFSNVYMYPEKPGVTGRIKKFDVLTGKADWDIPDPFPNWSGTVNTAGGLVFYGSLGGDFRAVDRKTGEIVWHRKLGSGIIGNPITYEVKGKQYVSVYSGIGGWIGLPVTAGLDLSDKFGAIGATAMTKATGLAMIPQGGMVSTFRLYQ